MPRQRQASRRPRRGIRGALPDVADDPLAGEPPADCDRHRQEDDRCDAPGRERHRGERGGQDHRRDRGHRDERRQDRVTQMGKDPPRPCVSDSVTRISHAAAARKIDRQPPPASQAPAKLRTMPQPARLAEHRAEEVLRPDGSHARHPLTCRYRACPGSLLALLSPRTACPGTGHLTAGHRRARATPSHLTDSPGLPAG